VRQAKRGISRHRTFPVDDFIDSPGWYAHIAGNPVLADTHGNQKFFEKYLAGMNVCQFSHISYLDQ
jgi:hypothetical protein